MRNVILLGPPGAGKGTQANRLESVLHIPHIASGDLLRDVRRKNTPLAQEVQVHMDAGKYVPDTLMNQLVLDRLNMPDARAGFLLDGFPRTLPQAEALDRAMAEEDRALDLAFYITAPEDVLVKRIGDRIICPQCHAIYNLVSRPPKQETICDVCGHGLERRRDEGRDTLRHRLGEFARQNDQLVKYYEARSILSRINGDSAMRDVEADIDAALQLKSVS